MQELEQQREVVRRLTADPGASPTASPGSRHTKAKSLGNACDSPLPVQDKGPGRTKMHISSTFTAHNLALPCTSATLHHPRSPKGLGATAGGATGSPSPSPLPSHPSQWNNSSAKKGRRVTIEHDIDLLAGELLTTGKGQS
jgi:centromeric protein E